MRPLAYPGMRIVYALPPLPDRLPRPWAALCIALMAGACWVVIVGVVAWVVR